MGATVPVIHHRAPDGRWGWAVVFGSFMLYVIGDGFSYTTGIFYAEFLNEYNETQTVTALFDSIMTGMIYCTGPFASGLTSVYGCRKIAMLGSVIAVLGMVLSIVFDDIYTHCLTLGFITGTGIGLLYLPQVIIITHWFDKRLAFATGIAVCGAGIGIAIFSLMIEYLIHWYGWKGAMLILAAIMFSCFGFSALFRNVSEDLEEKRSLKSALKETFNFEILKNIVFLYYGLTNFLIGTVYYVPMIFLKDHVIKTEMANETQAVTLMVVFGLANAIGRALFGYISDIEALNRLILYALSVLYYGVAIGLMAAFGKSYEKMIVCVIIYGTAEGAFICLSSVVIVDLFGVKRVSNAFGILNLIVGIAYFVGPPLIGKTFDGRNGYTTGFWISSVITIFSAFLLMFLPLIHSKYKELIPSID